MKIKTDNLEGIQLDWVVAHLNKETIQIGNITACNKIIGKCLAWVNHKDDFGTITYEPSIEWSQGGPIIERERIELGSYADQWQATMHLEDGSIFEHGPTPLIAAMRCYVASKLGNEINIPEALINK